MVVTDVESGERIGEQRKWKRQNLLHYVVHMPNNVAHVPNVPDMMVVVMVTNESDEMTTTKTDDQIFPWRKKNNRKTKDSLLMHYVANVPNVPDMMVTTEKG